MKNLAADVFNILANLPNKLKSLYSEVFFGYQVNQHLEIIDTTEDSI